MDKPLVSVVMPVYNREKYVGAAIESILSQTYTNFEFIIVDDGSTDHSVEVIQSYRDPRIRLIQLPNNQGISAARNAGNELARGEFIAVMDSDDIALPQRLEKELAYLHKHPEIGLCGASFRYFDDISQRLSKPRPVIRAITQHEKCHVSLLFCLPFAHPTILVRREVYKQLQYSLQWETTEDRIFLACAAQFTRLGGLKEVLLLVRDHKERSIFAHNGKHKNRELQNGYWMLNQMGLFLPEEDRVLWNILCVPNKNISIDELKAIDILGQRILVINQESSYLDQKHLQDTFARRWWNLCRLASPLGKEVFKIYCRSPLRYKGAVSALYALRMATLCLGIGREISLVRAVEKLMMQL